jgi:signal peptide peptidase SppA
MDLIDFSRGAFWGIVPATFEDLFRRVHGLNMGQPEMLQRALAGGGDLLPEKLYTVENGIAVIDIAGPLSKKLGFLSFLFGGASYQTALTAYQQALEDRAIDGIALRIDSPGGSLNGLEALSEFIFENRSKKPSVAYADGAMLSAAYWIGSSASKVVASRTASVGSIGVLMVHQDFSEYEKMRGIKTTYLSAGRYKAIGNDAEPLGETARSVFQEKLDYLYRIFVDAVAQSRGVDIEKGFAMADGRVFIGNQAQEAGLVDAVGDFKTALDMVSGNQPKTSIYFQNTEKGATEMKTVQELLAAYPDLMNEFKAGIISDHTGAVKAAEDRIFALVKIQFGDAEGGRFCELAATGISAEQFGKVKDLVQTVAPEPAVSAEETARKNAEMLSAIKAATPGPAGVVPPPVGGKDFQALVAEHRATWKVGHVEAMKAVIKANPEAHRVYVEKMNPGKQMLN